MERNPITLNDLNFYYDYIKQIVEENLVEFENISPDLIDNNIRLLLSEKIKQPKLLKEEIMILRNSETINKCSKIV